MRRIIAILETRAYLDNTSTHVAFFFSGYRGRISDKLAGVLILHTTRTNLKKHEGMALICGKEEYNRLTGVPRGMLHKSRAIK